MQLKIKSLKAEYLLLCIGLLALFFHYYIYSISLNQQMFILLTLVFLIGVPHGALDFLVDEQNEVYKNKPFIMKKFLFTYLSRLFIFAIFWFFPFLAFSLFIVFSIFHFGETDMAVFIKPTKSAPLLYILYGTFILSLLLITHLSEITVAIPIIGTYLKESAFINFVYKYDVILIFTTAALFFVCLYFCIKKGMMVKIKLTELLQFAVLIFIMVKLPMLLAFTFYFALWHSILSVRNIFAYFKSVNNAQKFNIICGKSILFSLLALGSIVGLYFAVHYFLPDMNLLFALLIVLSVLTVPHLTVMHGMYSNVGKRKALV